METQTAFDPASALWADVEPVKEEGTASLASSEVDDPKYSKAMDLFRALSRRPEHSSRTLALTAYLIRFNPSNGEVWKHPQAVMDFRAKILLQDELDAPPHPNDPFLPKVSETVEGRIADELDFMNALSGEKLNKQQLWSYRRPLVEELSKLINQRFVEGSEKSALQEWKQVAAGELAATRETLKLHRKDDRTWAHRRWTLAYFGGIRGDTKAKTAAPFDAIRKAAGKDVWSGEVEYIDELLKTQPANNHVWTHRHFTLFVCTEFRGKGEAKFIADEILYSAFQLTHNNNALWEYVRQIVKRLKDQKDEDGYKMCSSTVDRMAKALVPSSNAEFLANPDVDRKGRDDADPRALEWLMDASEERGSSRLDTMIYLDRLILADPKNAVVWRLKKESMQRINLLIAQSRPQARGP